jgi:glycosyltransferase involved in cell wall biosynthesis
VTHCCLVVTTHERPDALERVLAAVAAQTLAPDELVVADDGSGPVTAEVVGEE